ncbi:MAG: hypothetical protein IT564_03235 [Rhodospirillales bacterium]|nr:hypothetical protein [Rhodospirillales bacterium]
MTTVKMPMLGLTMSEGAIQKWLKSEGDAVRKGEPLLEVETDKVVMEVEAPTGGVLLKILRGANETVPVGTEIGVIGGVGETMG